MMAPDSKLPGDGLETHRSAAFVAGVCCGTLVVAVGVTALILGLSVNTYVSGAPSTPPAPAVSEPDRLLLLAIGIAGLLGGLALIRRSLRLVGFR